MANLLFYNRVLVNYTYTSQYNSLDTTQIARPLAIVGLGILNSSL